MLHLSRRFLEIGPKEAGTIISIFRQGSEILNEKTARGHRASYVADANTAVLSARCSNASLLKHWRRGKKGSQSSMVLQR